MFDISIDRKNGIIFLEYNQFLLEKKQGQELLKAMINSCHNKKFSVLMDFFDIKQLEPKKADQLVETIDFLLEKGMNNLAIVSAYNECLQQMVKLTAPIIKRNKKIHIYFHNGWQLAKESLEKKV